MSQTWGNWAALLPGGLAARFSSAALSVHVYVYGRKHLYKVTILNWVIFWVRYWIDKQNLIVFATLKLIFKTL